MPTSLVDFLRELKSAARSLARTKGLVVAVILTLALGIGANAAMFSLVSGVLLRPLVNRDESHLIYIRQVADGNNITFSVPEINDLSSRVKTLHAFGDFSTISFTLFGLGQPRTVQAGVVNGSYFQTMGLRPVLGRLLDARDDGPSAAGAVVLTYRFWSSTLGRDPSVIGKTVRLGSFIDTRTAVVVGVLEPSVPYPQDTEIISNIVTSAHHLSATMVQGRIHRMTELFARLSPGASLDQARAELAADYATMRREHPEAYQGSRDYHLTAVPLRQELTSGARSILLLLLAGSGLIFVIAWANVANLFLARTVRRENELGLRAALGASPGSLRRLLFAESLLLCVSGAAVGILIAHPLMAIMARYASRYSVRALDLSLDGNALWLAAALAVVAAALLALVPRLPGTRRAPALQVSGGSARSTGASNRKLKAFALVQIAACFMLLSATAMLVKTLVSLESVHAAFDTQNVLIVDIPVLRNGRSSSQIAAFYRDAQHRIAAIPGVARVALSSAVPWRDQNGFTLGFSKDGHRPAPTEIQPHAEFEIVSPGYFASLGLAMLAGRDFTEADRDGAAPVAIVSETLAQRMFPNGNALGHHVQWTDPVLQFLPIPPPQPMLIVGVVHDLDNGDLVPKPTLSIYQPDDQAVALMGGRMVVDADAGYDPYALVQPVTQVMHSLSADQPVENAKTLSDIRVQVLSPQRLNAVVSSVFGGVALLIAMVGIAGVLAFSVSGRTREFGIRLAIGSQPRRLLLGVIAEGAQMALGGLVLGLGCGYGLSLLAGKLFGGVELPDLLPLTVSALVLVLAAIFAAYLPAARAARVDVLEALRAD
ncbi:MAG TPA: ADOP family duplicated permease [Terriglobales bacterium]|nr:ADOP family duplicated permease [Terriglobales bacterium]